MWNKNLTKETDERVKVNAQNISKAIKLKYQDLEYKKRHKKGCENRKSVSIEVRKKKSKQMIKRWKEDDYIRKQMKARNRTVQNKSEKKLERFINGVIPNEYKFVGGGEFILGGKCPDFMNINGKKKLIELYGSYWHRNDNPQDRIDYFKQFGFDTLVIQESELRNPRILMNKINKFDCQSLEEI